MLILTQRELSQVQGRTALEVFPGKQGELAYRNHMRVITNGTVATVQIQLPVGEGFRHVVTTLNPIKDARGKVVQVVGTVDDITDLVSAQRTSAWADVARRIVTAAIQQHGAGRLVCAEHEARCDGD